jgi:predicted RNA-binding Zn-ribbon protein involved in translation (DUF1610 family)
MNPLPKNNGQPENPFSGYFSGQIGGASSQTSLGNMLGSGLRKIIWLILFAWLLGAIGLGWLIKFSLILVGLVIFTPVLGFIGLQWWLKKNLVKADCPVCGAELTGLNGAQMSCTSCGEALQVGNGQFNRPTQEGTIDVSAVDVSAIDVD